MMEPQTRNQIAPAEQMSQAIPQSPGYVLYSRNMMRAVLNETPLNLEHARSILKAVETYPGKYDPQALEIARELWRIVKEAEHVK